MRSVDLKMLKSKLSEYVRIAAGGETVLVTDRDPEPPCGSLTLAKIFNRLSYSSCAMAWYFRHHGSRDAHAPTRWIMNSFSLGHAAVKRPVVLVAGMLLSLNLAAPICSAYAAPDAIA